MGVRRRSVRVSTGGGSGAGASVMEVSPKPKGSTRATGNAPISTGAYTEIASYVPAVDKTFSVSKILVTWAGSDEMEIQVSIAGEIIGTYFATDYVECWFPAGVEVIGDNVEKASIAAKAVAGSATLTGFIEGELT